MSNGDRAASSRGVFLLAGLWSLVVLASLIAPRFVPAAEGFAAGAAAALVFLALLSLAALIAVWLLLQTLSRFRRLTPGARVAGVLPAVLNLAVLVWIWAWLDD